MRITNENITTLGQSMSANSLLEFYSNYKSYTTVIELRFGAPPSTSDEIICPDGTYAWYLQALPDNFPVGPIVPTLFQLVVNGSVINFANQSTDAVIPLQPIWKKQSQPFLEIKDTLQIVNNNFAGTFQFVFDRVMLRENN